MTAIPIMDLLTDDAQYIEDMRAGKEPMVLASMDAIRAAAGGSYQLLTWPGETGEPLLLDMTTASGLVLVYDALQRDANRAKFERMVQKSRGNFGRIVQFMWTQVKSTSLTKGD